MNTSTELLKEAGRWSFKEEEIDREEGRSDHGCYLLQRWVANSSKVVVKILAIDIETESSLCYVAQNQRPMLLFWMPLPIQLLLEMIHSQGGCLLKGGTRWNNCFLKIKPNITALMMLEYVRSCRYALRPFVDAMPCCGLWCWNMCGVALRPFVGGYFEIGWCDKASRYIAST